MKNHFKFIFAILTVCFLLPFQAITQTLAVSAIPENLSRGVNSVVRDFTRTFIFPGDYKMTAKETMSLTIMNEKALSIAHLSINYRDGEKVSIKSATIYNEDGIKTKMIKRSEMTDRSMVDNASLYNDTRIIYYRIVPVKYPFTVVYDYEISYNRLYGIDLFSPYMAENQSIEISELKVINPKNIPLNIKSFNLPPEVIEVQTDFTRSWVFSNLPSIPEEPMLPPAEEFVPYIRIAPEQIQYDNYKGQADTWENYGKFLAGLSKERRDLSNATVANLTTMVAKAGTTREKVRILYKYLQSRTHYINISLGIGGIQPHQASDVDELGYGDCKDLSNYMVAMLEAVGINSFYTLVNAGEGKYSFEKGLPGHQFNHAIVCVPVGNDTIWLECTNQVMPFGYLGSYTDNRQVLLITGNTGILAKTPEYTIDENTSDSKITIDYSSEGTAATANLSFSGLPMDELVFTASQNKADQLTWINKILEMNDFTVINHKFLVREEPKPTVSLELELALKSFFNGKNGRLFASLNLNNRISIPERVRNRKHQVYIPYSYTTNDTIRLNLPPGCTPEQLPESLIVSELFGRYSMSTRVSDNTITCIRKFELYKGTHAPDVYSDYYDFMQKVAIADSKQLVLIQN